MDSKFKNFKTLGLSPYDLKARVLREARRGSERDGHTFLLVRQKVQLGRREGETRFLERPAGDDVRIGGQRRA